MSTFPAPSTPPAKLEELYQSVILDHNRRPRNHREIEGADGRAEGKNPNCGDRVIVWLRLDGDTVVDVSFKVPPGEGCAISRASASIMTTAVKGKSVAEAEALFERFHDLVTGRVRSADARELGSLEVFSGVSRFPMRVKCASLSWHTLRSALREGIASARNV
jgi:nitrogen fixation NifU-like protein